MNLLEALEPDRWEQGPCGVPEYLMEVVGCGCDWNYLEAWGARLGCPNINVVRVGDKYVASLRDERGKVRFKATGWQRGDAITRLDTKLTEYVDKHYLVDDLRSATRDALTQEEGAALDAYNHRVLDHMRTRREEERAS